MNVSFVLIVPEVADVGSTCVNQHLHEVWNAAGEDEAEEVEEGGDEDLLCFHCYSAKTFISSEQH